MDRPLTADGEEPNPSTTVPVAKRKALTAAAVAKLKPANQTRRVKDGGTVGLALVIHPSGTRVWQFRARDANGKAKRIVLGPHDATGREMEGEPVIGQPLTLAAARALASRLWRERVLGQDPFSRPQAASAGKTFGEVAHEFVDKHAKRSTRRWRETARILGIDPDGGKVIPKSLADRWHDKPLGAIDGDIIHQVIEKASEDGVPGRGVKRKGYSAARGRALGRTLSAFFRWALRRRYIRVNPVAGIDIPKVGARDRVLSADEIRAVWNALDAAGDLPARVLKLLLLTGQRLNEIRCMRRSEIAVERGEATLRLPGQRTKNKRPHDVPLSAAAREIIDGAPLIDKSDFVFSLDGAAPVSVGSNEKDAIDDRVKLPHWVVHDFRRTVVTGMAEIGIAPHVIEAVVNHVSGHKAGVAGVYNKATYAAEKRVALERWAQRVAEIVEGRADDNVVPMRG